MLEQLWEGTSASLFGIFELTAKLHWRAADENHFVFEGWERPLDVTGRHVLAGKIGPLVAGIAAHTVNAATISATLHVLPVDMAVIALQRRVTRGMTVLAAGRGEDFVDLQKCFTRGVGIRFGRSWRGVN